MPGSVEGESELQGKLAGLISKVGGAGLGRSIFQGGLVLERLVKQNIRGKGLIDSGNYRASIRAVKVSDVRTEVFSHVVYGPIHEFGGTITAKRAPFLVFQVDGQWVRVRSVRIPARPHWRPAVKQGQRKILDEINKALLQEIKGVVG